MRVAVLAFLVAAVAVPAAGARERPPGDGERERPAPVEFPADAVDRIAAEVCAKVDVEGCLEKATALAEQAVERCRNSKEPAACVKEFVVHELREDDGDDERGDRAERAVAGTCAKAAEKRPEHFARAFDSIEACVAALQSAIESCPTEAAAKGCAEAALQKALRRDEASKRAEKLRRSAEKALCQADKREKRPCSEETRAKARELAERCASADEPKTCLREALKQARAKKRP